MSVIDRKCLQNLENQAFSPGQRTGRESDFLPGGNLPKGQQGMGSPTISLVMERRLENSHVPNACWANLTNLMKISARQMQDRYANIALPYER